MKKTIIVISILAALSVLTVGIVMAHPDGPEAPRFPGNPGFHGGMMGNGYHGYGGGYMADYMHAAFAEALGLSVDEFEARIEDGESMDDIALSLGFDAEEFAELHEQARQAAFEMAYADGLIDEEHYEWMQERMNGTGGYGMHDGGFARGGGGCHGNYQGTPSE